MNKLDRLKEAQHALRLNNRQMAAELNVSEFWLSKVLNGHRPASADLMLRLDDTLRRKNIVLTATPGIPPQVMAVGEAMAAYETGDATADIRRRIEEVIHYAAGDPGRLGWIREQVIQHVQAPVHWNIHEQVMKKVQQQRLMRDQHQSHTKPSVKTGEATG